MGQDDSAVHGKHLPPSPRRQPNKSSLKAPKKPPPPAPPQDQAQDHIRLLYPDLGRQPGDRFSYSPSSSHRSGPAQPPHSSLADPAPAARCRTASDPQAGAEPAAQPHNPTGSTGVLRRKVLSRHTGRHLQEKVLQRQGSGRGQQEAPGSPSRHSPATVQVPWEKEVNKEGLLGLGLCLGQGRTSGPAAVQDQGLLEEIESMCCLSSVLHTGLQLSQVHCNNGHQQVHTKASDES